MIIRHRQTDSERVRTSLRESGERLHIKPRTYFASDGKVENENKASSQIRHELGGVTLFPIQRKLIVGSPDDPAEREADEVADKVMRFGGEKDIHSAINSTTTPDVHVARRKSRTREFLSATKNNSTYTIDRLISMYGFSRPGALGLVGNLVKESAMLPNRIEGSTEDAPMIARGFDHKNHTFSEADVMKRNKAEKQGPRKPGIGIAQWTTAGRRAALFRHEYNGEVLGPDILSNLDAQIDYLVHELKTTKSYRALYQRLCDPEISVEDASDAVVTVFEVPGAILTEGKNSTTGRRERLPESDERVQKVLDERRGLAFTASDWTADKQTEVRRVPSQEVPKFKQLEDVNDVVQPVLQSGGHALDSHTRGFMESRFGHDFSSVRVHTDAQAARSAAAVNARAYAVGPNIFFGDGEFQPRTDSGKHLIAHELAHVMQQSQKSMLSVRREIPNDEPRLMSSNPEELSDKELLNEYKITLTNSNPDTESYFRSLEEELDRRGLSANTKQNGVATGDSYSDLMVWAGIEVLAHSFREAASRSGLYRSLYQDALGKIEVEGSRLLASGVRPRQVAKKLALMRIAAKSQVQQESGRVLQYAAQLFDVVRGKEFPKNIKDLMQELRRTKSNAEIIESASRSNKFVNALPNGIRYMGRAVAIAGIGYSFYVVWNASPQDKAKVAIEEVSSYAGSFAAAAVCTAFGIATGGLGLLACGLVGGLAGGIAAHAVMDNDNEK